MAARDLTGGAPSGSVPGVQSEPEAAKQPRAVSAGRGIVYITGAKLWFMVGGYAILFALPRVLDKALVGQWNVILAWVSVLNNVMVTATIQGVSKFGSTGQPAQRAALKLLFAVGAATALVFLLGAPLIAGFEHDPALVPGLRIVAAVVFCYALYAVFVGAANGARAFHKQAGLDATYSTLRATFVVAGAAALHAVVGAFVGFAAASVVILLVSTVVVGFGPPEPPGRMAPLVRFIAPIAAFLLIMNTLMFVDLWLLKRMVFEGAVAHGLAGAPVTVEAAAKWASEQAATYGNGVQAFARMPYQLILSVTFVIFPLVSRSTFAEDRAATRLYVERAMRYSLLVVAAMAAAVAARPEPLLALLGPAYTAGATALPALAFGYVAYSLLSIASTIINGSGRTLPTIGIGAVTLAVDAGANFAALRWATAGGHDPLRAAAVATAASMAFGLAVSLVYLQRSFGASLRALSLARAAVAAAVALGVGRVLPLHGKAALATVVAAGLAFVATLFVTGELTLGELRALRRRG